jgi:hypothetical protein
MVSTEKSNVEKKENPVKESKNESKLGNFLKATENKNNIKQNEKISTNESANMNKIEQINVTNNLNSGNVNIDILNKNQLETKIDIKKPLKLDTNAKEYTPKSFANKNNNDDKKTEIVPNNPITNQNTEQSLYDTNFNNRNFNEGNHNFNIYNQNQNNRGYNTYYNNNNYGRNNYNNNFKKNNY